MKEEAASEWRVSNGPQDARHELAVVMLEELVAQAFHGTAKYLELLQQVQNYVHGGLWEVRLMHIDALAKVSPMWRTPLFFLQG